MPDKILILLAVLAFSWPQWAAANTGIARGGEHETFTRVTISTEQDISEVQLRQIGPRRFALKVTPPLDRLDASRLFDRLGANRVRALEESEEGLVLDLGCACDASVRVEGDRLIVFDIRDGDQEIAVVLPVLPEATGLWPEPAFPQRPTGPQPDPFDLDFSVVDRLTRSIASQMTQTSHISGFSEIAQSVGASVPQELPEAARETTPDATPDACKWSRAVWHRIEDAEANHPGNRSLDHESVAGVDDPAQAAHEVILDYLMAGSVEEAGALFQSTDPGPKDTQAFTQFVGALLGTGPALSLRMGACDPLADLILAAASPAHDLPDSAKLGALHSFSSLPVGLQVILFPRLDAVFQDTSQALFPALVAHFEAEAALTSRLPVQDIGVDQDPDRLAAVSRELRGTEHETDSWTASFSAFLQHQRYFDALQALQSEHPLTQTDARAAGARLLDHATENAESVVFLELAMTRIAELDPSLPVASLQRAADRLAAEGFVEEAGVFLRATVRDGPFAAATGIAEGVAVEEQAAEDGDVVDPVPPVSLATAVDRPDKDGVTVASAREQLERTSAVREELVKVFEE